MLVAQAVGQFEAWTGKTAPVAAMSQAACEALAPADATDRVGAAS
jgi:shikimate 5-dehydrogenase